MMLRLGVPACASTPKPLGLSLAIARSCGPRRPSGEKNGNAYHESNCPFLPRHQDDQDRW